MKYVHLTGNEDFGYVLQEEVLEYNERKILYLVSELEDDSFTFGCGEGGTISRQETKTAYVKGYIVKWKCAKDEKGANISELAAINSEEQEAIKQLIQSACAVKFVHFEQGPC